MPGTVVLAVGAHPDDVDAFCGGTLALLADRGVPAHVAIATGGEGGVPGEPAERAREIRLAEARRAGELLGAASVEWLGMHDQEAVASRAARARLADHVRRLGANLLLTHPPGDYHADHRAVAELVLAMRIGACAGNLGSEPPLRSAPDLAYVDAAQGLAFEPHVWIDVTATWERKLAALRAHESQRTLGGETELVPLIESLGRLRGDQRGCRYAEAFAGCGTWPTPDGGIRRLVLLAEAGVP
ncbi:MAG: PIG-L family deacetylase [Thermoleophilia bacterium]|nr:PIG-L family deacetylase [Thermoleophilia bacterium]